MCDFYDIKLFYENEGLIEDLFWIFLIYIVCLLCLVYELLDLNFIDFDEFYMKEFEGMMKVCVNFDDFFEI